MLLQCGCISCLSRVFFFPLPFSFTPPSGPPRLFLASSVAVGVKQVTNGRITRLSIAGHCELFDKLFRAPTFSFPAGSVGGSGARNDGLCQQLLFSLLGKSQETLMHAKAGVPAFFIFSLLGSASSHRFMQRIEEIRDEAGWGQQE